MWQIIPSLLNLGADLEGALGPRIAAEQSLPLISARASPETNSAPRVIPVPLYLIMSR
jgi:hypothetical protein